MEVQTAWLLYNSHADTALYQQLMDGGRTDGSDRFATADAADGLGEILRCGERMNYRRMGKYNRAIAILNAAKAAFPGNRTVINALAGGYAAAGRSKDAVAIFRAEDLTHASAAELQRRQLDRRWRRTI